MICWLRTLLLLLVATISIFSLPANSSAVDNIATYQIITNQPANGSIVCLPQQVSKGAESICTITPHADYRLLAITDTFNAATTDVLAQVVNSTTFSISNITSDHSINVTFEHNPIDGVCGPASGTTFSSTPDTELCSIGPMTGFADAGTGITTSRWTWDCQGQYTGSITAHCSANYHRLPTFTPGTPPNNTTDVAISTNAITAVFDQDMNEASINSNSFNVNRKVKITKIAAGAFHSLALKSDGTVAAWGANEFYDGHGTSVYNQSVVPDGLTNVISITGNLDQSLALKNDGTIVVWGLRSKTYPTTDVTAIAAKGQMLYFDTPNLALNSNGTVYDLDNNISSDYISGVTSIAAGTGFYLALKNDNTVMNHSGFFEQYVNKWTPVVGLSGVTAIAAGEFYSLALKNDGTVVTWGQGAPPVPTDLSGVTAIAAGNNHNLALKSNGTVVAWGSNDAGQSSVPSDLSDVIAIAAGQYHSMALKSDGTVVAWGSNGYGQTTLPANLYESPVKGTVTYNQGSRTATFNPSAPLPGGAIINVSIKNTVVDLDGYHPITDSNWLFATQSVPQLETTPKNVSFGTVVVNQPAASTANFTRSPDTEVVSISNNGSATLNISNISLIGTDNFQFLLSTNAGTGYSCGSVTRSLDPGKACTITVSFKPSSQGTKSASLQIGSNDSLSNSTDIPLDGNGRLLTVSFLLGNFGSALQGTTTQQLPYGGTISSMTAFPAANSHFLNWTGTGGFITTTQNPLPAFTASADMTITANFYADPINGTCGYSSNQVLAMSTPEAPCGTGVLFGSITGNGSLANPWSWLCSGQYGGTNSSICTALIKTYNLLFTSSGGTLSGSTIQVINHGATSSPVSISLPTDYSVLWSSPNGFTSTDNPLAVNNVMASMQIAANIAANAPSTSFPTLQSAYNAAEIGAGLHLSTVADVPAGPGSPSEMIADLAKEVRITGGYDALYKSRSGFSVVTGTIRINNGKLIADRISVRP